MPDFAARVMKLVAEPDYKPITLKAMSRRSRSSPTITPSSAARSSGW